jgi:hypothetical protein
VLDRDTMVEALDAVRKGKNSGPGLMRPFVGSLWRGNSWGQPVMQTNGTTKSSVGTVAASSAAEAVAPAGNICDCGTTTGECGCGGAGPPVYVIGTIDVQFPDPSLENELDMLVRDLDLPSGRIDDPTWLSDVLSRDAARYIARELYWILSVEDQDRYLLKLRDPRDWGALIEGLRHRPSRIGSFVADSQVVIGVKGPEVRIGDVLHLLLVDRIAVTTLTAAAVQAAPRSRAKTPQPPSEPSRSFRRLLKQADNYGDTDPARAINYLIAQYKPLHELVFAREASEYVLRQIDVENSRLIGQRRIVDPIIRFAHEATGVEDRYFVRVDVTHKFPMHITDIEPL